VRVVFAGTPEFAERALAALVGAGHGIPLILTQPDRPAGRGMQPAASPVKRFALARGLALHQPASLKDAANAAPIEAAKPDVIVVAAYGLILPQRVLDLAPHGAINIHASLLPRWRGAAPIQRALMAGDSETGITIMQMDSGLDTGPILAQQAVPIAPDDDAGTLHDRLALLGAELIVRALEALARGALAPQPQPASGACYAPKLGRQDAQLDWIRPAIELERLVRALRPAPGALTTLGGEPLKVWDARVVAGRGHPGEVIGTSDAGLVVACGTDALALRRLQRSGGRQLDAGSFLRGRPVGVGERLGAPTR